MARVSCIKLILHSMILTSIRLTFKHYCMYISNLLLQSRREGSSSEELSKSLPSRSPIKISKKKLADKHAGLKAANSKAKRPMNAFMLFAKKFRLEYTQMYPGKDNRWGLQTCCLKTSLAMKPGYLLGFYLIVIKLSKMDGSYTDSPDWIHFQGNKCAVGW